jgi:glutathione S-transferase
LRIATFRNKYLIYYSDNFNVFHSTYRAHLNDLENILPFLIVALLYISTNPAAATAGLLFKTYTIARFFHTFVYAVYPVRQPARALAWFVGIFIQFYMAFAVISYNM